ncbi:DUF1850 domain-containing protein [Granulosicoccus antarcticus]|uniref:DUF1850 domain-containing protein n=1 Tax=Granulosicoccus antarcticus IMCC3135 TaxID=1192854 RepID=A0A2Z2NPZ0_9GAMM|nr:DUF1850 domain-containing protein [Granulosicoccus antarcticus]ASJ70840.1 hypothetical protein IMCC3135_03635 [Granulosicoccus antarcticus IMCC3135]
MSALCVATAAALFSWSTSSFTLSWTHSVEKTEWQESWVIEDNALVLESARVKGSGAGMDPGEGAKLIDGWWQWQPTLPPLPALHLSASGATASPWTLCVADECMSLGEQAEAAVKLWSCPEKAESH